MTPAHRLRFPFALMATLVLAMTCTARAASAADAPTPLPQLAVAPYMGTWYQVALYPNRFQAQCVSDTTATYRDLGAAGIEVTNRCRLADGRIDDVQGLARPPAGVSAVRDGVLSPARLQVSFLPAWLRWTGIGWGNYWVLHRADDGRFVIVGEGTREYLWVLSRTPRLAPADEAAVRERLVALGYDLSRLAPHPHSAAPAR